MRWRTQRGHTAGIDDDDALPVGNKGATYIIIIYNSNGCCRNKRQSEELAQHALVTVGGELSQVAVTVVVHTLHAVVLPTHMVDVHGRQHKHWHKYGQQHP